MSDRWSLSLVAAPAEEPLTLDEAKHHCRVENMKDDALIRNMIVAARHHVENVLRRQLVTATWKLVMDCFPDWEIRMPKPPLLSATSITHLDTAGVRQTLSASIYQVDTTSEPGLIMPAYDESWPTIRNVTGSVEIIFVAGYGAATAVPQGIKNWMQRWIAEQNENREMTSEQSITPFPYLDGLLDPYRWGSYA